MKTTEMSRKTLFLIIAASVVFVLPTFLVAILTSETSSSNTPLTKSTPKPIIYNQLNECIEKAEAKYEEDLDKQIEARGFDFFDQKKVAQYKKKMEENGISSKDITRYISREQRTQRNLDGQLQDRMMKEKELCAKLYKK